MTNKFKVLISKVIFFVIMINIIFSYTIFSSTTAMSLVVNSNVVSLTNEIELINGRYYISINDISNLGINVYTDNDYSYELHFYNTNMYFYSDSNYVYLNGEQLYDMKPRVKVDNETYVAIDLIAIAFGKNYIIDEANSVISFDLVNPYFQTITGRISLPNNEVAPSGGLPVIVFCGEVYMYGDTYEYAVIKKASVSLTIPSGENNIEYSVFADTSKGVAIGYTIENENYSSGYYVNGEIVDKLGTTYPGLYRYSNIDITIISSKMFDISGKIQLPEEYTNSNGVSLTLNLISGQYYENIRDTIYMTIPSGAKSANFKLSIKDVNTSVTLKYSIQNETNGLWKTGYYAPNTAVMYYGYASFFDTNTTVADVSFNIMAAKTLTAKIKLPYGMIAKSNIRASMYLVPHIEPQLMLANLGSSSSANSSSGSATKPSSGISAPIPQPSGGGGGFVAPIFDTLLPVAVKIGSTNGELKIDLPVLGNQKYDLALRYINGDSRFYDSIYYTQNGSSSYKKDMMLIDENTGSVDITLLKQNSIYGKLERKPINKEFVAYAIPQVNENQKTLLYDAPFYECSYYDSYNDIFILNVPEDVQKYIIGYNKTSEYGIANYYSENGTVSSINDADIVTVNNDINGINMTFVGNKPTIPINIFGYTIRDSIYSQTSTYADVCLQNLSDYDEDATVYVVGYNSGKKIAKTYIGNVNIQSNIYGNISIPLPDDFKDGGSYSKLFMWDKQMSPLSLPSVCTNLSDVGATKDIIVMIDNVEVEFYVKPIIFQGQIMFPLGRLAIELNTDYTWNSVAETIYASLEKHTVSLQIGSTKAYVDNVEVTIEVAPQIINDSVFVPVMFFAQSLNIPITWNSKINTISITTIN